MSGPESKPDDALLDEFLAGRSDLSQAYRAAAKEAPPAELDGAVLEFARREAARVPEPGRMRRARLWERTRWPVAAAAMLVLSFNVLVAIRDDRAARRASMIEPEAPMAMEAADQAAAAVSAPEAELQLAPPPPPPPTAPAEADASTLANVPAAAPAAPPPAVREDSERKAVAQARAQSQAQESARAAEQLRDRDRAMRAESARQKTEGFAAQAPPALAGAGTRAAGVAEEFLARPGVVRMPDGGVVLESATAIVRLGLRRADGSCELAPPRLVPEGEVEVRRAYDPETCETLVDRGVPR